MSLSRFRLNLPIGRIVIKDEPLSLHNPLGIS